MAHDLVGDHPYFCGLGISKAASPLSFYRADLDDDLAGMKPSSPFVTWSYLSKSHYISPQAFSRLPNCFQLQFKTPVFMFNVIVHLDCLSL